MKQKYQSLSSNPFNGVSCILIACPTDSVCTCMTAHVGVHVQHMYSVLLLSAKFFLEREMSILLLACLEVS